ncbi:MAG TPA: extracellular solute-binding protein [Solirubrobacterales bacterium]|nr:extracellular solute-binding protein [Solirubrobacterales bacterium]
MRIRTLHVLALLVAAFALALAGCGDDDDGGGGNGGGAANVSGSVDVAGVWTGEEAQSFEAVLDGFREEYPNVNVSYDAAGDELPTILATAVQGGNPPDLAAVPQPGSVADFYEQGALKPLTFAEDTIKDGFTPGAVEVATFKDQVYGFVFKAANKSTVWYNVGLFETAGVKPPETFDELLKSAETLKASGTKAYSIGVDAGWPLTDLFENIYLREAGPEKYDQLAEHKIPWTDQSVKDALKTMTEIIGDSDNIVGGTSGALQTDFPTSVTNAFKENPEGAMVLEGDFVVTEIEAGTQAKPMTDYDVFDFPSVDGSEPVVVGGGDVLIMFNDTPASQALVEYLASSEAAEIWAKRGGFSSANRDLDTNVYPDELTRETAGTIAEAETFRFDLSDLQPAAFGATVGKGMWQALTEFMENQNVDATARKLEQEANKAF